jgi:hypothetical protein
MSDQQSISEYLLANRERLGFEDARLQLVKRSRVRTPLGAAEFLGRTLDHGRETYDNRVRVCAEVMSMYREIFPEHYERSDSPHYSTMREHEFYRLVNQHLFPLRLSEDVDLETHMRREPSFFLPFIPVKGTQKHTWALGGFNFRKIEIEYQIPQVLSDRMESPGLDGWQTLRIMYGVEGERPAPPLGSVGWQLFNYSCTTSETPLKYLPLAFRMTSYKTGNVWLDLSPVGYIGSEWKREQLARIAEEWLKADHAYLQMKALGCWLEEDPKARIEEIVMIWNKASVTEREYGYEGMLGDDLARMHGARVMGEDAWGEPMVAMTLPGEIFRVFAGRDLAPAPETAELPPAEAEQLGTGELLP